MEEEGSDGSRGTHHVVVHRRSTPSSYNKELCNRDLITIRVREDLGRRRARGRDPMFNFRETISELFSLYTSLDFL